MTLDAADIDTEITVDGLALDDEQQAVVDAYEENVETFIRKNSDYDDSYVNSAATHCLLSSGSVTDEALIEAVTQQVWVRILDKISRAHQLLFERETPLVADEGVDDTLLDMANYCVMLATQIRLAKQGDYAARYVSGPDDHPYHRVGGGGGFGTNLE